MGRTKEPFTGHTELRTSFSRKGAIKKADKGVELRMYIIYTQVQHKENYGYIYQVFTLVKLLLGIMNGNGPGLPGHLKKQRKYLKPLNVYIKPFLEQLVHA